MPPASPTPERDVMLRVSRLFWYVGCLAMPAAAVRIAGVTIGDASFLLAAVAAALSGSRFRPPVQRIGWTVAAMLAVAAALLAQPISGQEGANLAVAGRMVFLWVVWSYTATAILGTHQHVVKSLRLFILGCAASAAAGIAQAALGVTIFGVSAFGFQDRASGLAEHVNDQGGQLAIAVAMGVMLWATKTVGGIWHLAPVAVCAVGLLASGSVTGLLSLLAALVFIGVRLARRPGRFVFLATLVAAAGYVVVRIQERLTGVTPMERLATATGAEGNTNTLDLRLRTLDVAWREISESPIRGAGLDTLSGGTYNGVTQAHNIFVLFWYQGGALLLVALAIALGSALLLFTGRSGHTPLKPTLAAGFVAALVYAQTAPIMFQRYFWLPAVLLFAVQAVRERAALDSTGDRPGLELRVKHGDPARNL